MDDAANGRGCGGVGGLNYMRVNVCGGGCLGATPYAGFDFTNYVSLDDGTMVGFVFGHTARYRAAEDFGYNLYRLNPDGTAVFLNAGCRRGGSELYVQDGKAHWTVNGETFSASI